jgi:DNA-binding Lrp family transcriptional regulator
LTPSFATVPLPAHGDERINPGRLAGRNVRCAEVAGVDQQGSGRAQFVGQIADLAQRGLSLCCLSLAAWVAWAAATSRLSGDVDYLHVVVADIAFYDHFYRKLIAAVPLRNVSSRFSMERMKDAPLPV